MRGTFWALLWLAGSAAAQNIVTPQGIGAGWSLQSIDGAPFDARAELDLSTLGRVNGSGPCNGFSGRLEGDWSAFSIGPLRSTRRACPDLPQEHLFMRALQAMRQAELRGDTLVLTDGAGREMVFTPAPAP